jgi:uncharacterized protein YfkK (UPF0435 family)
MKGAFESDGKGKGNLYKDIFNEDWDSDDEKDGKESPLVVDKSAKKAPPKTDYIKESKLIARLKPLLDKVTEDDLKKYQFEGGARDKVQFNQYPAITSANKQIFDVTGLFKNMAQLNAACNFYGSVFLQYLLIVRKDIPLSPFTKKFLEREGIRNFRGKLIKALDEMRESLDMVNSGIITKEDFEKDRLDIVEWFKEKEKDSVAKFLDEKLEGEDGRSKNNRDQIKHRSLKAIRSGLKVV